MTKRMRGRLAAAWRRAAEADGYSLSEMMVVLAILGIVIAALVQLFVSASNAQVDMSKRVEAQQNARLALDTLRREIHCAKAVSLTGTSPWSSITIKLGAYCSTNTTGADADFTWCTTGASSRFALSRYSGTACTGTPRKWADYLTTGQVFTGYSPPVVSSSWSANTAYVVGQYVRPTDTVASPYLFRVTAAGTSGTTQPTWPAALNATVASGATFQNVGALNFALGKLTVSLPVDVTPSDAKQRYTLQDDIVLRNTR
jgi:prepilin-type N-terminal cleavage/methylation domain-containing protein